MNLPLKNVILYIDCLICIKLFLKRSKYQYFVGNCLPLTFENGDVEYHPKPVDGEDLPGTIAFFTCDDEYMRVGSLFVTCQESGIWSPQSPTCEEGIAIIYHSQHQNLYSLSMRYYSI